MVLPLEELLELPSVVPSEPEALPKPVLPLPLSLPEPLPKPPLPLPLPLSLPDPLPDPLSLPLPEPFSLPDPLSLPAPVSPVDSPLEPVVSPVVPKVDWEPPVELRPVAPLEASPDDPVAVLTAPVVAAFPVDDLPEDFPDADLPVETAPVRVAPVAVPSVMVPRELPPVVVSPPVVESTGRAGAARRTGGANHSVAALDAAALGPVTPIRLGDHLPTGIAKVAARPDVLVEARRAIGQAVAVGAVAADLARWTRVGGAAGGRGAGPGGHAPARRARAGWASRREAGRLRGRGERLAAGRGAARCHSSRRSTHLWSSTTRSLRQAMSP